MSILIELTKDDIGDTKWKELLAAIEIAEEKAFGEDANKLPSTSEITHVNVDVYDAWNDSHHPKQMRPIRDLEAL